MVTLDLILSYLKSKVRVILSPDCSSDGEMFPVCIQRNSVLCFPHSSFPVYCPSPLTVACYAFEKLMVKEKEGAENAEILMGDLGRTNR